MAAFSAIAAGVGLGLSAIGAGTSIFGAMNASEAQQQQLAIQQQQEQQRKVAMEMDARRRSVEAIRNQQRARSVALANAGAQGALFGSGLQAGYGQIAGRTSDNLLGIYGSREVGRNMFDLNQQMAGAQSDYASAQSMMGIGSGLSSLGGALLSNLGTINAIGKGFGGSSGYGPINYGYANPNAGSGTSYGIIGVGPYG